MLKDFHHGFVTLTLLGVRPELILAGYRMIMAMFTALQQREHSAISQVTVVGNGDVVATVAFLADLIETGPQLAVDGRVDVRDRQCRDRLSGADEH